MKRLIILLIISILVVGILTSSLIVAQPNFEPPKDLFKRLQGYGGVTIHCPQSSNANGDINAIKNTLQKYKQGIRDVNDDEINDFVTQCNNQKSFWIKPKPLEPKIQECIDKFSSEIGDNAKFLTSKIREECVIEDHFDKSNFFLRIFKQNLYNSLLSERQTEIKQKLIQDFDTCANIPVDEGEEFSCEQYKLDLQKEEYAKEFPEYGMFYNPKGEGK